MTGAARLCFFLLVLFLGKLTLIAKDVKRAGDKR